MMTPQRTEQLIQDLRALGCQSSVYSIQKQLSLQRQATGTTIHLGKAAQDIILKYAGIVSRTRDEQLTANANYIREMRQLPECCDFSDERFSDERLKGALRRKRREINREIKQQRERMLADFQANVGFTH